ncbi:MAG TPA: FAD-linked oxidase C-terminal domain-containing protein [Candidatus Binatia bacterium]|nr:FAD-linked oxidase C-terminal domain-containing protein [Candidatus Binatia bacterium]
MVAGAIKKVAGYRRGAGNAIEDEGCDTAVFAPSMTLDKNILGQLRAIVGERGIVGGRASLKVYECDGYTLEKAAPQLVVLPETVEQTARVVSLLAGASIPYVPRGAGTGVSGGCLPVEAPVMIGTSRLRRIRSIDLDNRVAEVEAGVVNLEVTRAVEAQGYYYAPDPSSQSACTIGGNVAENSGGPHTLKYGVTVNHLLALELVLPDGRVVWLDRSGDAPGYDLVGLVTGSEGTLGLVTAARVRLLRKPESVTTLLGVFATVADASRAVSAIIAAGIVPAALEMMDALVIAAVEAAYHFGFPTDAGAVLLIELDGLTAGLDELAERVSAACIAEGAKEVRRAGDEAERALLWKSRKRAFGAMGRLTRSYCTQDGVVPRSRLPEIVAVVADVASRYDLRIANLMHAGDGNIHPLILYDESKPGEVERVIAAGNEILTACLDLGGSITGEHGIGVEKLGLMDTAFGAATMAAMADVRDAFNPLGLCNPNKVVPTDRGCIEVVRPRPRGGG